MRKNLFRFLLLKVLPGRLIPFLTVFEVFMMLRRMRRNRPVAPRRLVTSVLPMRRVGPVVDTDAPATAAPIGQVGPPLR